MAVKIINEAKVTTIDITPTWSDLVGIMLHTRGELVRLRKSTKDMDAEFARMALAADYWNEHVKAEKGKAA